MKKCPYCAEFVQRDAIKCRFCKEMIRDVDLADENVLIDAKPALRVFSKEIIFGLLLLPLLGAGLFIWLHVALKRWGVHYTITNRRVIVKTGIIAKKIDEIGIKDIRSIITRQKPLERILGCGDLYIGTAGTADNEIIMKGITDPVEIKELLARQKSILSRKPG